MAAGLTPTLSVQIGFTAGTLDALAGIAWTDITSYVMEINTSAGRQHVRSQPEASTAQLTLKNIDGRFSPHNTTGAYYPNVNPMVRIRIRATYNAVTYNVFLGYVTSWKPEWPDFRNGICHIDCVDAFKLLALKELDGAYKAEVVADNPTLWWRFGETIGATTAADLSGNNLSGTYYGAPGLQSTSGLPYETNGAVDFDGQEGRVVARYGGIPNLSGSSALTVEFWFRTGVNPGLLGSIAAIGGTDATGALYTNFVFAGTTNAGLLVVGLNVTVFGSWASVQSTVVVTDNVLHHAVARFPANGGTPTLHIDGTDVSTAAHTSGALTVNGSVIVGNTNRTVATTAAFQGTLDELALYTSSLSTARISAHYTAGSSPRNAEQTGARIGFVADQIGWPAADRSIETGISQLGPARLSGSALQMFQTISDTEAGLFFIDPAGILTFYQRHHIITNAASNTSQATFGDSGSENGYRFGSDSLVLDDEDVWNEVRVSREGGIEQVVSDATSQSSYGKRTLTKSGLINNSDLEAFDNANWLLAHYKTPLTRIPELVITPERAPATLYPQALGRKLWDRVTAKRRPANSTTFSQDVLIEGIAHRIIPGQRVWETRFQLSPAETQSYWILGTSALGTDTRVAF